MRLPQFVPWSTDAEELVFPCHTSIMSKDLLISKMKDQGYCPKDYSEAEKSENVPAAEKTTEKKDHSSIINAKRSMNLTELLAEQEDKEENQLTRVEI
jgi:hypothetical protein